MTNENTDDEVVFQARFEDFTKQFFDSFDKNIDKIAQKTEQGFSNVNQKVSEVGPTLAIIGGAVAGLTQKLVEYALHLTDGFIDFLTASEKVAERVESLGVSLRIVGENTGVSSQALSEYEQGMKDVGLTTIESRQALLKMIQSELDLKDSAKLAQIALDASATGNTTVMSAQERLIQAITYASPRMLKGLGLVVDFQSGFKRAQLELGRALSDTEKKQISLNLVLEAGTKIQGAYTASLSTATGQENEKQHAIESLQEALGKVGTAASYESLKATNEVLTELLNYVTEHKDDIKELGDSFAIVTRVVISITKELLSLWKVLADAGPIGVSIKSLQHWREQLGLSSEPLAILRDVLEGINEIFITGAVGVTIYSTALEKLVGTVSAITKNKLGIISDKEMRDTFAALPNIKDEVRKTLESLLAPLNTDKEALDNTAKAAENLAENLSEKLAAAVQEASAQLQKLKESQELAASERAIKVQRTQIEEELKLQWDREDQERTSAERVQQILTNAEDARVNLAQQASDNRLQIEIDYRKRLTQMLEDFNYQSSELARKRDAVGLLQLARQYNRDLGKEKKAQEERRQAANDSYQKSIAELDKSLQKQLANAEEARTKELESYQRNLDRQKELKDLHNQWEEEDRQRQLERTLAEMVKGFSSIDGMTQEGLQRLVDQWSSYFGALPNIVASNMALAAQAYSDYASAIGTASVNVGTPNVGGWSDVGAGGRNKGQSGLVSQLLTPEGIGNAATIGQTPTVRPSSMNYDKRDINVHVDGTALDPYIQRQVVKTLEEIERNRG